MRHIFELLFLYAQNLKVKESEDSLPLQRQADTKLHQLLFQLFQNQIVEIKVKSHYTMTFRLHKLVKNLLDKMPILLDSQGNLSKILFNLV